MGNEYNRFQHQKLHLYPRNTFLPMLCSKPSIKDVAFPKCVDRSVSFSNDPLSPKISCMGQVKRNNKVVGFPTSTHKLTQTTRHSTNNNTNNSVKYSKLKKMFSSKNLATTMATNTATTTCSCGSKRVTMNGNENRACINIVDMDPPLPVIKKVKKPEGEEGDSLWKRRSGGVALKTLQLQQLHHSKHHL